MILSLAILLHTTVEAQYQGAIRVWEFWVSQVQVAGSSSFRHTAPFWLAMRFDCSIPLWKASKSGVSCSASHIAAHVPFRHGQNWTHTLACGNIMNSSFERQLANRYIVT